MVHRRAAAAAVAEPVRLQKLLAQAGFGSRREIEDWITAGRLTLNARLAQLGNRATLRDRIELDGKPLVFEKASDEVRVLVYHKPEGELVSRSDPKGRPTVFANLPKIAGAKWMSIGRLDYNTSGLLLFTNSGALANGLMHPRFAIEREYAVRIFGGLSEEEVARLLAGIELGDGPAAFGKVVAAGGDGANRWYKVTLQEGRNREVRRLIEALDKQVSRLMRLRYGPVRLPEDLKPGEWRELEPAKIALLTAS
ncbi:MAG: pseudouridine synthase [Betaproteobacteria bacterium]|nr:pseudouridine synthase [Betaproteobacteria bacterium]